MKNSLRLLFLLVSAVLLGCDRPNSNPELLDPIYMDLSKTAEEAKKSISELKKDVDSAEKELHEVKPQTGEISFAKKHWETAVEKLDRAQQQALYLEIRAESRKKYDQAQYIQAWKEKKPWPNPTEYSAFKAAEKSNSAKTDWNLADRFSAAGLPPPIGGGKKAAEGKKEEKKEEKKE